MNRFLQNALFFAGYGLFTSVYIPLALMLGTPVALLIPHRSALRMTRRIIHYYGAVTVWLARPWIRCFVENRSGVAAGKPCLFISNHQSIADPYLMGLFPNEFVFISNHWPFQIPLIGFFAKLAGYLNAQSLEPAIFIEQAQGRLREGVTLFSFAEGTRTRTGKLGHFHSTVFRLALQARVPIVPVCISGLFGIIPPGHRFLRPGTIRVHALKAIEPADYEGLNPHQLKHKVRNLIAAELAVMEGSVPCN